MRPYPSGNLNVAKTIFNKRLSRTRVAVECAFAILSNKWRVSMQSIEIYTKNRKLVIKVVSLLHNIVRDVDDQDVTGCTTNLENRNSTANSRRNNRASSCAPSIRDHSKDYFINNLIGSNLFFKFLDNIRLV
nr:unnamed protein product [Callosobruchus analis]